MLGSSMRAISPLRVWRWNTICRPARKLRTPAPNVGRHENFARRRRFLRVLFPVPASLSCSSLSASSAGYRLARATPQFCRLCYFLRPTDPFRTSRRNCSNFIASWTSYSCIDITTATGRPCFAMVTGSRCAASSNAPKLVLACAAGMGFFTVRLPIHPSQVVLIRMLKMYKMIENCQSAFGPAIESR